MTLQFAINGGTYENEMKIAKHNHLPIAHDVCDIRSECVLGLEGNYHEMGEKSKSKPTQTELSDKSSDSSTSYAGGESGSEKPDSINNGDSTTEKPFTPSEEFVSSSSIEIDRSTLASDDEDQDKSENHSTATERKG